MTIEAFQQRIKGVSLTILQRNSDKSLLHIPPAKGVTMDLGIEEAVQEINNPLGEVVTAGSYVTARKPMINMTFAHSQPEVWELVLGTRFEVKTSEVIIAKQLTVPNSLTLPAVGAGQLGKGMLADQTESRASIKTTFGMSEQLVRVPYSNATTPPAGSWAQGADFAMKFGPDLVGETVTVIAPVPLTSTLTLGETPVGSYRMKALCVLTNNEVAIISADSCTPKLNGNTVDPAAAEIPVGFYLHQTPGQCLPYRIQYTGQYVNC